MKMTLNVSHVILGPSGVNSIASLPRMIYRTPLRYSSYSTSAEQRQLQASHTSTFPKTSGKAPHSQSTSSPWDCPCDTTDTKHSPGALALQTNIPHSSNAKDDVLTFTPCVLQDKRNGKRKTVQSIAVSAYLLFSPHHYITFRPQAWNCCSYTLLAWDKLFFAFFFNFKFFKLPIKRAWRGLRLFCILSVKPSRREKANRLHCNA